MADLGTLGAFTDFMAASRERPMSGPDRIHNMMTGYRTYLCRRIMDGLSEDDYFQDGTKIVEQVQLKYDANARDYLPTDDQNPTADNSLTQLEVPWRFRLVDSTWTDHEIELNSGGDQAAMFKRLKKVKRQKLYTDFWDKCEAALWAQPNAAHMEGGNSTGKQWYSLRSLVTFAGGVPTTTAIASGGDGAADSWSTVHQVSPTTYPNWANQYTTYDSANIDEELIDALDEMAIKVHFQAPEAGSGNTGSKDTPRSKQLIVTNLEGYKKLIKIARSQNNSNSPAANIGWANGRVYYNGFEVFYASALDSILTAGEPAFWFLNFNFIKFVFHKNRWLKAISKDGGVRQPFSHVEYRDTWGNLVCINRREQGIVRAA